jgi:hypothetical protein
MKLFNWGASPPALCAMPYALCPFPFELSALSFLGYSLSASPPALCAMLYALCPMLFPLSALLAPLNFYLVKSQRACPEPAEGLFHWG